MKRLFLITLAIIVSIGVKANDKLPNIYILATGGTIAGVGASATSGEYSAGEVSIDILIDAVPQIKEIANIKGEQIVKIGSQDMTDLVMLELAKRINTLLKRKDVDGVVITHGTDTMEETAYFLNLTVKSDKPVVLVGAMRPSTSLSADGPLNLYNAVVVAADKSSHGRGVMVVMNGTINSAHGVVKMNTTDVQAFQSPNSGALGYVNGSRVVFNMLSDKRHTTQSVFDVSKSKTLPKVGVIYGHSNIEPIIIDAFINNGFKGLIHAGVGNGNIHKDIINKFVVARKMDIMIVRATRVPSGPVTQTGEIDDDKYGFIASEELNPQKARILLMLSLLITDDYKQIQRYFEEY